MKYAIFTALLLSMFSCLDYPGYSESKQDSIGPYTDIRTQFLNDYYSQYSSLRGQAIDSIQSYIDDSLRYVAFLIHYPPWQIDSLLFFSSDSTRFYTKLHNASEHAATEKLDCIIDFGGALIEGKWYFFQMGTVTYVSRGDWHYDPYEPLTFEELSYIAWRRAIPGLIYRRRDGSIATDHKAIDRMFFSTDRVWCPDSSRIRACNDSITLSNHRRIIKGRMNREDILRVQEDIQNSKKPSVPSRKELTWWDRLWGKEEKLFDRKAWRERYNYKNEEDEG